MEQNGINQLAGALVDFTAGIAESKVDNAQYDKSFNTVIWGTNRLFTDDVPQSTQDQLIKEYQIPETSEKHFYTFVIDGKYYVKESEKTFMLYQKVVIRVPNGNWDRMIIERPEHAEDNRIIAGTGIEVEGREIKKISLKRAEIGEYYDEGWKKALGGIYIDRFLWGSRDGLWIDKYGALKLLPADGGGLGKGRIEGATGYGGVSIGKGIATTYKGHISVNLGEGMRFNEPPGTASQYESNWTVSPKTGDGLTIKTGEGEDGTVRLNLGKGLEFGAREYEKKKDPVTGEETDEDDPTRYTSEVRVKLGKNLSFGENGEINAAGTELKAGENIEISDGGVISAIVREYKAGENIEISEDGTISAAAPGGSGLTAGGGIAIETDAETGKQTVSAAVGEGAEIRDGKICTVPNIQTGILITEKDAKYLLHNFTQIEYNRGVQIGYAEPANQIVVQGNMIYKRAFLQSGGRVSQNDTFFPYGWSPQFSVYTSSELDWYYLFQNTQWHLNNPRLELKNTLPDRMAFDFCADKEDGERVNLSSSFFNYYHWSGVGFVFSWEEIHPPGYTITVNNEQITFQNGGIRATKHWLFRRNETRETFDSWYQLTFPYYGASSDWIPFASLAEYQAAVGLTYEPLTLTEVTDSPTVVSENDIQ